MTEFCPAMQHRVTCMRTQAPARRHLKFIITAPSVLTHTISLPSRVTQGSQKSDWNTAAVIQMSLHVLVTLRAALRKDQRWVQLCPILLGVLSLKVSQYLALLGDKSSLPPHKGQNKIIS